MERTFYQALLPEGIYVIPEKVIQSAIIPEIDIIEEKLSFIGDNNQKILILLNTSASDSEMLSDREFLNKILGAVKITFNDIALLYVSDYSDLNYERLEGSIFFKKIISFGYDLAQLANNPLIQKYKIQLVNEVEVLWVDGLDEIQSEKAKKIKLWDELKRLFQ